MISKIYSIWSLQAKSATATLTFLDFPLGFTLLGLACERFGVSGDISLHDFNALARPHVSRRDFLGINPIEKSRNVQPQ